MSRSSRRHDVFLTGAGRVSCLRLVACIKLVVVVVEVIMADETVAIERLYGASNGEAHRDELSHSGQEESPAVSEAISEKLKRIVEENLLVILTVAAVIVGVCIGLGVRHANLSPAQVIYFGFPGELLIRLLKMIIIPLVVCSLVSGAASIDPKALGRLGGWAMLFFLVTTLISSAIGVVMAFIIQPGSSKGTEPKMTSIDENVPESKEVVDSFLDLIR